MFCGILLFSLGNICIEPKHAGREGVSERKCKVANESLWKGVVYCASCSILLSTIAVQMLVHASIMTQGYWNDFIT